MNTTALQITKKFEQCRLTSYWDGKGQRWSCGWGETGPDIVQGLVWTQQQADDRLAARLTPLEAQIRALLKVALPDAAMGALISLAYNAGMGVLTGSKAIAAVNARDWLAAAKEILDDDHVRGVEDRALLKRRCYEVYIFLDNV